MEENDKIFWSNPARVYNLEQVQGKIQQGQPGRTACVHIAGRQRIVGEMEEIAKTFDVVGVTPHFHQGAAETFRLLNSTSFAAENPENIDRSRTLKDTIEEAARRLSKRAGPYTPAVSMSTVHPIFRYMSLFSRAPLLMHTFT